MQKLKYSYTIACPTVFKEAVEALATTKSMTVSDIARAVMVLFDEQDINAAPDPGEPPAYDRERILVKSGDGAGRRLTRKPRLQIRMIAGYDTVFIRKALMLALLRTGKLTDEVIPSDGQLQLGDAPPPSAVIEEKPLPPQAALQKLIDVMLPADRLPTNRREAKRYLGFALSDVVDHGDITKRYRLLASVFHPDAPWGDSERMIGLNAAKDLLFAPL